MRSGSSLRVGLEQHSRREHLEVRVAKVESLVPSDDFNVVTLVLINSSHIENTQLAFS